MVEAHPMEAKRNAELIADTICVVAYDYVNNDGDDTDFFNKVRYLVHKYDEELQRQALMIGGMPNETAES